jgi:hypothetical protein
VLSRDITQKHFYDFLERPKNPRSGFNELTTKMLEKDIYLNSLRPWNPTPAKFNQYIPTASTARFASAKCQDVNFRLEMLRQKMESNKLQEFQVAPAQTRFAVAQSGFGPTQPATSKAGQQVVRTVERTPDEKVFRMSTPAYYQACTVETREPMVSSFVRENPRMNGASPAAYRSLPVENQMNLRSSLIQSSMEAVKNEAVPTLTCSFQNFDDTHPRVFQSNEKPAQINTGDSRVVRCQSTGILALNRAQTTQQIQQPIRGSVTRVESKTYVGAPVQINSVSNPASLPTRSYFLSSNYTKPTDSFSSYAQNIASSISVAAKTPATRILEASPAACDSFRMSGTTIDNFQDDDSPSSPYPKSPLRSILKRHCSQSKKKRVTVDENKNEVKEFVKVSPRKLSFCFPADTNILKITTTNPTTTDSRPLPTQQRIIQPFVSIPTNIPTNSFNPTATNRQFEGPHIRSHSRIML